ncbi:MAG: hypothetical protein LBL42_01165 [Tannerella sp.]|jgi:hypothetical protein|nr:hypothetical protein [Tannerella sp.]
MQNAKNPLFPRTLNALVKDLNEKQSYLEANAERLGIPSSELDVIREQVDAVNEAKAATDDRDMCSKHDIDVRNRAMRTAKGTLRRVTGYFVRDNSDATSEDCEVLHVYRRSKEARQLLSPPESAPGIGQISSKDSVLTVPFFDPATGRRGRPEGVQFMEAVYRFGGKAPARAEFLTDGSVCITASPMRLPMKPGGNVKVLHIAFRWIGTRGDFGPWSKIYRVTLLK